MENRFVGVKISPLFGSVLIMLIPVIVKSTLVPSANFTVLMAGAFLIQIYFYYVAYIAGNPIQISPPMVILLLNACISIFVNVLSGRGVNENDIINTLVKTVNIVFFVDAVAGKTIEREQLERYAKLIMGLSIAACFYNLFINMNSLGTALTNYGSPYGVNLKSFFINRNQFGMALVIWFIMTDLAYVGKKSLAKTLVHLLQVVNIILTLSRGAIAAVVVYWLARQLIFYTGEKTVRYVATFLGVIILAALAIYTPQLNIILKNKILRVNVGDAGRADVWLTGLQVFLINPLNGVGTYTGLDIALAQGFEFGQFHNFFIDTLVGGGIIELCVVLSIIQKVYKKCVVKLMGTDYLAIYRSAMIALVCTGLIESVSFFSMGYVDTMFTIHYITLPVLMSNMNVEFSAGSGGD